MFSVFRRNKGQTGARELKNYYSVIDQINSLESTYTQMSDEQLQSMTTTFKQQLQNGESLSAIIPDAFAVVREASKRVLGLRHYDVQLIAGLVLAEGNIAEMPTGEGKTLVASLPSYVRALEGKGVHVITVNDYLSKRDYELIGQIHQFLGLTVGLNIAEMDTHEKRAAYQADITYGVGTEFGFDYLRDHMALSLDEQVQRPYHFAMIDEVDSVLIDEAKTPLIIAGKMMGNEELHRIASILASRFTADEDYDYDPETKATSLTDEGVAKVEKAFAIDNLYDLQHQTLYHYVIQAVRAAVMFARDVDYIVRDSKIELVDMFTGRVMEGRSLSDGLHQALEAKEGLPITEENKAQAQVTIQNYFRMYPILSGMTGTAKTQDKEFQEVYNMSVIQIPTNQPRRRVDHPDVVFPTLAAKYRYVAELAEQRHKQGQPVLIGTTSILQSEQIASYLEKQGLPYHILNAKTIEQEVEFISKAGQKGLITVATNMAGRGTDIVPDAAAIAAGGLFVIGTEKHESRRVDNQLRGRSGRQGDIGESQFVLSLEDEMLQRYAPEDVEKLKKKLKSNQTQPIDSKDVISLIDRTQRIVEGSHFSMREYNLKLDDVINEQRTIIYALRDRVLNKNNVFELLQHFVSETIEIILQNAPTALAENEQVALEQLENSLQATLLTQIQLPPQAQNAQQIRQALEPALKATQMSILDHQCDLRAEDVVTQIMLMNIDQMWVKHLEQMTQLREGIGLRHYQQEDPMRIYQREGLELFSANYQDLRCEIVEELVAFFRSLSENQEEF